MRSTDARQRIGDLFIREGDLVDCRESCGDVDRRHAGRERTDHVERDSRRGLARVFLRDLAAIQEPRRIDRVAAIDHVGGFLRFVGFVDGDDATAEQLVAHIGIATLDRDGLARHRHDP
jgi:hypothetical protein